MKPAPPVTTSGFFFTNAQVSGPHGTMMIHSIAAIGMFSPYSLEELRFWDYVSDGSISAGRTTGRRDRRSRAKNGVANRWSRHRREKKLCRPVEVWWYEVPMDRWPKLPYVCVFSGEYRQATVAAPRRRGGASQLERWSAKDMQCTAQEEKPERKEAPRVAEKEDSPKPAPAAVKRRSWQPIELELGGPLGIHIHATQLELVDHFHCALQPSLNVRWQGLYLDMEAEEDIAYEDSSPSGEQDRSSDPTRGSAEDFSSVNDPASDTGEASGQRGRLGRGSGLSRFSAEVFSSVNDPASDTGEASGQ